MTKISLSGKADVSALALEATLVAMKGTGFATETDSLKILSDVLDLIRTELTFQQQPDATLSQDNPVSGTKYTVLDTTLNCRLISIQVIVTWTVQPTPLEVHITIDGQSITHVLANPTSATNYHAIRSPKDLPSAQDLQQIALDATRINLPTFLYEGRSIKVEIETTGGTVSNISSRIKYAKR